MNENKQNNQTVMRYVIFCAHYLPHVGGVERYTYNLASEIIKNGNEVIVITSLLDNHPLIEVVDSIKIYRVPSYLLLNGRFPIVKITKLYKNVLKMLKEYKPDLIIIQTRFYLLSLIGAIFSYKNKFKFITIEHGTAHFSVNFPILDWIGHLYEHFITLILKRYCINFYGVSSASNQWLMHFKIKSKDIIYNAVNIDDIEYNLQNPVMDYFNMLSLPNDAYIVAFIGRLLKQKGVMELIEAIKILNKTYKNLFLIIAGVGELQDKIFNETNHNIRFLGQIDFKNVIAVLKQANIFCLPTIYPEGLPTSILEAAACKCFIISTTSGGTKELIVNESYGIINQDNTINSICRSIKQVIENPTYRLQAIELTYQRLLSDFSWNKNIVILKKIIKGE